MADKAKDWEDVKSYTLEEDTETELLDKQNECTFIWVGKEGHPMGVIVNYVFADGKFWLTATETRARVNAVRKDGRVSIAITSKGAGFSTSKSLSYKGIAVVRNDDETKAWFYPALAARVRPDSPEKAAQFVTFLDSPGRVIFEVTPDVRIGFDSSKMWKAAPSAAPTDAPKELFQD